MGINLLLAFLWLIFAYQQVSVFLETREIAYLLFCLLETTQAILFLIRSRAHLVSNDRLEWAVAIGGTFFPLLFRATDVVLWQGGFILLSITSVFQLIALLSLNRSFGIVPARREIKTRGLYAWVRHPIYLGYIFSLTSYLLSNFSLQNSAIYLAVMAFLFMRIRFEERLLLQSEAYRAYQSRVRWRLVPYVY